MPLRSIAIDDEPLALKVIEKYAAKIPAIDLIQTFDDALFAAEFIRGNPVDLIFLDINMPDITGLDLVRSLEIKPIIIFTTAHKQYAFEGFEVEALDYLLKPIDHTRFSRAVKKALDFHAYKKQPTTSDQSEALFVYSGYKLVKIELNEVEYIESLEDYIKIHIKDKNPVLSLITMKKVLEKLPVEKFRRIHRSYIVPIGKVKAISNKKVLLSSGKNLPISQSYTDFIRDWTGS